METNLAEFIRDTTVGREADAILRNCVHCGFCNATCPTYQLLGDELDGPRGRIYLIKQILEGQPVTEKTRLHLDRCLTCRSCETTCPSGVKYHRLLDIGRQVVEQHVPRSGREALIRYALQTTLPKPALFGAVVKLGQLAKPLLRAELTNKLPRFSAVGSKRWPGRSQNRKMLVLAGCVQPTLGPGINIATARLLDELGITLVEAPGAGCCGALRFHLNAHDAAFNDMRRNIDAWWPHIESGVEAIVMTASGCGVHVKQYGELLAHDEAYAYKAKRIAALTLDVSEVVLSEADNLREILNRRKGGQDRVAFHSPCTLQHGQQIRNVIEDLLRSAGFTITAVQDAHLCCGSAGTYSILQPDLSKRLRANKLTALNEEQPHIIATANIGCVVHLQAGTPLPVRHWIELMSESISPI